jgi:hypothetical protein
MASIDGHYPLQLQFAVLAFGNEFKATNAQGIIVAYAKQKLLKFKEEVNIYTDESQTGLLCQIKANKWLDFSASYQFSNNDGASLGRVVRKGWASLWSAHYELYDEKDQQDLIIREENPFAKVMDGILSEIPLLGILTGYLFNPRYIVKRPDGAEVVRMKKLPSFFGRKFSVEPLNTFEQGEEERILFGLTMMLMLERRRG